MAQKNVVPQEATCSACSVPVKKYVQCIVCNNAYHANCVIKMRGVFVDSNKELHCCDSLTSISESGIMEVREDIPGVDEALHVEIKYLKTIVENKDQIIKELLDKIIVLKKYNDLADSLHKVTPSGRTNYKQNSDDGVNKATPSGNNQQRIPDKAMEKRDNVESKKQSRKTTASSKTKILTADVNMVNVPAVSVLRGVSADEVEVLDETVVKPNHDDGKWSTIERRGNRKAVIGTMKGGAAGQQSSLIAVQKKCHLFVSRLRPGTEAEEVNSFLRPNFGGVSCEPLKSKYPESYASFRVTVDSDKLQEIMDPSQWPIGTLVTRFFQQREKKKSTT